MGLVHAKEITNLENVNSKMEKDTKSHLADDPSIRTANHINIEGVKARVDKIFVEGLSRTKDDVVIKCVRDLFKAQDFPSVLLSATKARQQLDNLGCFKNIGIYIDTSKGPKSTADGLEVTFYVKEHKRLIGGISTAVGNNSEGNLIISLKSPNILGRGERVQFEYSYGSRRTDNISLALIKPLFLFRNSSISASFFQTGSEWPWSGYRLIDKGVNLDFQFFSTSVIKHNIQWEGVVRNLGVISKSSSFDVREQAGIRLKSSLKHILSVDHRDQKIFPTNGSLLQLTSELAGVGGDIEFLKNDMLVQMNYSILQDVVLQGSLQGGFLKSLGEKKVMLVDQFYLGGPLNLRGFQTRGVGPHSDGNALGSDIFWAAALHIFAPLPFRPGKGGLGDLFRTHAFINFGSVGDFKFDNDVINNLKVLSSELRVAYGIGLALKLGDMARVELNYCFPVLWRKGDVPNSGIQFGVGVNFL